MKENITPLDYFNYTIENNNITLINYKALDTTVNIASEYKIKNKKYQVTELKQRCFYVSEINKITLPNTIQIIPEECFSHCRNLKEITIPDSVSKIKREAFLYCTSLKNIILSNNIIEIGVSAFESNYNLTEVNFPSSLKVIGHRAFMKCANLKKVVCPKNLEQIGVDCFNGCKKLKTVRINDKIKEILKDSFENCGQVELNDIENNNIKIKNNNVFEKNLSNELLNSYQKEDTLILNKNEKLGYCITNNNIKNFYTTDSEIRSIAFDNIERIIAPNVKYIYGFRLNEFSLKSIYISNKCDIIENLNIKHIYYNGTKEKMESSVKLMDKNNIIYKKDVNELLEDGYNFKQIDQIMKGYNKNILLSNINKDIDYLIMKDITTYFEYNDFKLYRLLELMQQEVNINNQMEINEILYEKLFK